jgi:hypothetical protein
MRRRSAGYPRPPFPPSRMWKRWFQRNLVCKGEMFLRRHSTPSACQREPPFTELTSVLASPMIPSNLSRTSSSTTSPEYTSSSRSFRPPVRLAPLNASHYGRATTSESAAWLGLPFEGWRRLAQYYLCPHSHSYWCSLKICNGAVHWRDVHCATESRINAASLRNIDSAGKTGPARVQARSRSTAKVCRDGSAEKQNTRPIAHPASRVASVRERRAVPQRPRGGRNLGLDAAPTGTPVQSPRRFFASTNSQGRNPQLIEALAQRDGSVSSTWLIHRPWKASRRVFHANLDGVAPCSPSLLFAYESIPRRNPLVVEEFLQRDSALSPP